MLRPRAVSLLPLLFALACSGEDDGGADRSAAEAPIRPDPAPTADEAERAEREAEAARMDREFPLHGLVTGVQLTVRESPDPEGEVVGWLRIGNRVRLGAERVRTSTCNTGWYPVYPRGHVCAGLGVEVGEAPPDAAMVVDPPAVDAPLPYSYWFVTETLVPQYHRLPTRTEQREAQAFIDHYVELLGRHEDRAARYLAGELPGNRPEKPAVVARFLERGFWLAGTGVETREDRRFVRTVSGAFVKQARLEERTGSAFVGVELGEDRPLPVAWALRGIEPREKREQFDGSLRFVRDLEATPIPRQTLIEGYVGRRRFGDEWYHELPGDRFAKDWFVGVAERIDVPFELEAPHEPWVHVDLSSQTAVLYRGTEPVFATLVTSGLDGHDTPTGTFRVQRKVVSDTMADLGPEAGDDRYRIEDVPWTQYFDGSVALHGALWHGRFGLRRSHGCINLSPRDARRIFDATWPRLPPGWHGVRTEGTGFRASRVHVTE